MALVDVAPTVTAGPRTLRALLVGIDAYRDPVPPLRGCVADVERVAKLLRQRAAAAGDRLQLRVLRDGEATRGAVIDAFRSWLGAEPSDTALFYYSGHGSQQLLGPGALPVEPDDANETLVLVDSRDRGGFDLADKELGRLVAEVADVAGHVLVALDCCHAGSGVRDTDDTRTRQAPADDRPRPADSYLTSRAPAREEPAAAPPAGPAAAARGGGEDALPVSPRPQRLTGGAGAAASSDPDEQRLGGRYVLLAACRADQTAKEVRIDGAHRGAFSAALESALAQGGHPDYLSLQRSIAAAVRNLATDQSPVLEAPTPGDIRLPFLGGVAAPLQPLLTAAYVARVGWVLDAGRLHGLAPDSAAPTTFDLYPLLSSADAPVATARAAEVRAASTVLTIAGAPGLDRGATYRAVLTSSPQPATAVSVVGGGAAVERLRTRLSASVVVRLAEAADGDDADGDLVVHADATHLTLTRPGSPQPLTAVEDAADPDAVGRIVAACEHIGRWLAIVRRQNPGSPLNERVELTVRDRAGDTLPEAGGRIEVAYTGPGEEDSPVVTVSFTNRSTGPLHCAVLVLTELYGVESLTVGGSVLLAPGQTSWVTDDQGRPQVRTTVPDGEDRTTDVLKLVVSGEAFDAQSMSQGELLPPTLTRGSTAEVGKGVTRKTALPSGQDWATREVLITTVRPGRWTELGATSQDVRPLALDVAVVGHPTVRARVRLRSRSTAARDTLVPLLPPALQHPDAATEPFTFSGTRSVGDELAVLEVDASGGTEGVTAEQPLRLRIARPLEDGELVVPVAYDGQDYLPLGRAVAAGDGMEIVLERLPLVDDEDRKSLGGSVAILFRKLVLRRLGLDYPYPMLSVVRYDSGRPVHVHEPDAVADAVRGATRVLLVVHGIIGDTRSLVGALAAGPHPLHAGYDCVLALDYENLHTSVAQTAAALRDRMRELGLGEGRRVDVVAHSMGGLVARWWIEREGGDQAVRRLVMCGTPHGGSPWPRVQDLATTGLALALNGIGHPVGNALGFLVKGIEAVDATLDAMTPGSELLLALAANPAPAVDYVAVAGDRPFGDAADPGRVRRLLTKLRLPAVVVGAVFDGGPNDLAVSVASASAVGRDWYSPPPVLSADTNHFGYFASPSALATLHEALPPR